MLVATRIEWQTVAHAGRKSADERLVLLLASGRTSRDAAKLCGIAERTVHRRQQDPAFRERINAARASFTTNALGRLAGDSTAAAETLRKLLDAESETVRLGACRAILELSARLRESVELEQRITALEQRCEQSQSN